MAVAAPSCAPCTPRVHSLQRLPTPSRPRLQTAELEAAQARAAVLRASKARKEATLRAWQLRRSEAARRVAHLEEDGLRALVSRSSLLAHGERPLFTRRTRAAITMTASRARAAGMQDAKETLQAALLTAQAVGRQLSVDGVALAAAASQCNAAAADLAARAAQLQAAHLAAAGAAVDFDRRAAAMVGRARRL